MREDQRMARFSPVTPGSRRLGKQLRLLREGRQLTMDHVAQHVRSSPSRIARIESGEIKVRAGAVMELLTAYGVPFDGEPGQSLLAMARNLGEPGWWQRYGTLSSKYATYIAYEEEARDALLFEPTLIPGLLQTERYARTVISVGRETDTEAIEQRLRARLKRQQVLTRSLRLQAVISEAALMVEVGGEETLDQQLEHITKIASRPNVVIQVLRYAAGAHLATYGGFTVLEFPDDPTLGYIETLAGDLFLESPDYINRLARAHENLRTLALSPAESIKFIGELRQWRTRGGRPPGQAMTAPV